MMTIYRRERCLRRYIDSGSVLDIESDGDFQAYSPLFGAAMVTQDHRLSPGFASSAVAWKGRVLFLTMFGRRNSQSPGGDNLRGMVRYEQRRLHQDGGIFMDKAWKRIGRCQGGALGQEPSVWRGRGSPAERN